MWCSGFVSSVRVLFGDKERWKINVKKLIKNWEERNREKKGGGARLWIFSE